MLKIYKIKIGKEKIKIYVWHIMGITESVLRNNTWTEVL